MDGLGPASVSNPSWVADCAYTQEMLIVARSSPQLSEIGSDQRAAASLVITLTGFVLVIMAVSASWIVHIITVSVITTVVPIITAVPVVPIITAIPIAPVT
mmetsp:Transcript_29260/g.45841  ORF Transcript_29260/g.45841 Transcript_29260/m.45841 type:complete len:101 (-) Transcript_29260:1338-1640(-)